MQKELHQLHEPMVFLGSFLDTGVVSDDIVLFIVALLDWSDVCISRGKPDDILFLCKVKGSDPLYTWLEVEHKSWIGTYIHQPCFESSSSIVDFDFITRQSC